MSAPRMLASEAVGEVVLLEGLDAVAFLAGALLARRDLLRVALERFSEGRVLRFLARHVRALVHLGLDEARPALRFGLGVKGLRDGRMAHAADLGLPLVRAAVNDGGHCCPRNGVERARVPNLSQKLDFYVPVFGVSS
jgi:hypothetical protein